MKKSKGRKPDARFRSKGVRFRQQKPKFSSALGNSFPSWIFQTVVSGLTIAILLFILVNFYVFASIVSIDSFLFVFLILTVLTDGLFIFLQIFQRHKRNHAPKLDPEKVTAVIACYNGEDVIGETIDHLLRHLPARNIIVVSDASTDQTEQIARNKGVRVITNQENLHKAFSVSVGAYEVETPYTLLLDDDVLVGDAVIPTNFMDQGYSAVAFDVMPKKTDTFVNTLQMFEYRSSMQIGKGLRAGSNSIGNVSGAIGLYRTDDLRNQAYLHSGQFAGEDEQRTLLTHIYGEGKGITFCHETVKTHVPNTFHALYRQRAYSWSLSVPEQFLLYIRIIFSPRYHYLLKAEKAYYVYIYLTDPLRLLFLWTLLLRPRYLVMTYVVYLFINSVAWLRTGRKDHFLTILVFPFYTLWLSLCRFIGNFYWLKVKAVYFNKRLHHFVEHRRMIVEFAVIVAVFVLSWAFSGIHFFNDVRLFQKIRTSKLEEQAQVFQYDNEPGEKLTEASSLNLKFSEFAPVAGTYIAVELEQGDTLRAIAHKAIDKYTAARSDIQPSYEQRAEFDRKVLLALQSSSVYFHAQSSTLMIDNTILEGVFNQ